MPPFFESKSLGILATATTRSSRSAGFRSATKVGDSERITLIEGDKVVSKDREVAKTLKSYFETVVKNLDINSKLILTYVNN